jgi:N-acetylneuraminate synthase
MGAIIEEISTTHHNDDSFYSDPLITALKREERKTIVEGWGGH